MLNNFWLIPMPVLATLILTLFLGGKLQRNSAFLGMVGTISSLALALSCLPDIIAGEVAYITFPWFAGLELGFILDPLTMILLLLVSFLATLILLYAYGYMEGESGQLRFFAEVQLFVFSMLSVVLADNLLQAFIFWEVMGLCSYLLIGFWFFKPSAAAAAKKAFLTTRVGDVFMLIGIVILFNMFGTVAYADMFALASAGAYDATMLTVATMCLFGGVIGKSAQFPLHVWLPDAMEGPTPVSALIHAATMVKAGIYLIARLFPLFVLTPTTNEFMIIIGSLTALATALMALVNCDFKRILAFSTLSQLGFMVVALGCGSYVAAVLHLVNHAFFKALLFMGAGSAIHGTHTNNIYEMGGLLKHQKITGLTMLCATVSIAGIPPFSGFWSKDEILAAAEHHSTFAFYVLALTSLLTAFYMFRLFYVVFTGKKRTDYHEHESNWGMVTPLVILAFFALGSGALSEPIQKFLTGEVIHHETHFVMYVSICVVAVGVIASTLMYFTGTFKAETVANATKPIHKLLLNRYYIDGAYEAFCKYVIVGTAKAANFFDKYVIDGIVNFFAWCVVKIATFCRWFDYNVVDGAIRGFCATVSFIGSTIRNSTNGNIQTYLTVVTGGFLILIIVAIGGMLI